MKKYNLFRNIETLLKDGVACQNTIQGSLIRDKGPTNIQSLKDRSGASIYESNRTIEHLKLGQITVVNDSVPGPSSSGFVDITIPINRIRTSGGPSVLRPIKSKLFVSTNSSRRITSCASAGAGSVRTVKGRSSSGGCTCAPHEIRTGCAGTTKGDGDTRTDALLIEDPTCSAFV